MLYVVERIELAGFALADLVRLVEIAITMALSVTGKGMRGTTSRCSCCRYSSLILIM